LVVAAAVVAAAVVAAAVVAAGVAVPQDAMLTIMSNTRTRDRMLWGIFFLTYGSSLFLLSYTVHGFRQPATDKNDGTTGSVMMKTFSQCCFHDAPVMFP
jgi:hypothetical protein